MFDDDRWKYQIRFNRYVLYYETLVLLWLIVLTVVVFMHLTGV